MCQDYWGFACQPCCILTAQKKLCVENPFFEKSRQKLAEHFQSKLSSYTNPFQNSVYNYSGYILTQLTYFSLVELGFFYLPFALHGTV